MPLGKPGWRLQPLPRPSTVGDGPRRGYLPPHGQEWESRTLRPGYTPARRSRGRLNMEFQGTERYYLDPELGAIVNMALVMEKPLLLTGEAGTGKTQLGFEVGRALGMPIEALRCKSTIKGEEACYVQDTVLRLNDARFGTASDRPQRRRLLRLRDLGAHRPRLPERRARRAPPRRDRQDRVGRAGQPPRRAGGLPVHDPRGQPDHPGDASGRSSSSPRTPSASSPIPSCGAATATTSPSPPRSRCGRS